MTFVIGCARSGTTLLRAMLDSHPEVAVPPEAYFVLPVLRHASRYLCDGRLDRDRLLEDIEREQSFSNWQLGGGALDRVRRDASVTTVPDAVAGVYAAYAQAHGKARCADKTPRHVLYVDLLSEAFPGARFVHLVRDGRDVVPSLLEMPFGPDTFGAATLYWRDRVMAGRSARRRLPPGAYLELRYEELVADPERVSARLCRFLDLSYSSDMIGYHRRSGGVVLGAAQAGRHPGVRRPPTADVRDWRTALSPHRVQLFEALAGDLVEQLGYEGSGRPTPRRVRLEAAAWRTARDLRLTSRLVRSRVGRRLGRRPIPRTGRGDDARSVP